MVPYYVRHLGIEAYGLVAFNSVLLSVFMLLDMGLSPTLGREVACFRAGTVERNDLISLLFSLEKLFLGIALLLVFFVFFTSDLLGSHWFQSKALTSKTVAYCLVWMATMAGFRWLSTLYRGGVIGLEKQVWLNAFNCIVFTLRFAGVVPIIMVWPRIDLFFIYQTTVACLECAILRGYLWQKLEICSPFTTLFSWNILRRHAMFSGSLAFTSVIWVLVSQTDKLILSKFLPLGEYGYFSLAVLIAGGINVLVAPFHQAFSPRFTVAAAEKCGRNLFDLYHLATQLVAVVAMPVGLVISVWPENVLLAWTGDRQLAALVAPILVWYTLGNVCLAMITPVFYLQFAYGKMKLHVIGNVLFGILVVPAMVCAAIKYGAIGAAYTWFVMNLLFLLFWVPIVHARFAPGENKQWYFRNLLLPALSVAIVGIVGNMLNVGLSATRSSAFLTCILTWAIAMILALMASSHIRGRLPGIFASNKR